MFDRNVEPGVFDFKPQKRGRSKLPLERDPDVDLESDILHNLRREADIPALELPESEITPSLRAALIDWIITACCKLKLCQ